MGNRALIRACQGIVNQIRRILHGRWEDEDLQYLKQLQKIGVAIMKAIDDNTEMEEVIVSATTELEELLNKLQMPINSLGTEEMDDTEEEPSEEPSDEPSDEEPMKQGSELGV
jgi:hypothetical protein